MRTVALYELLPCVFSILGKEEASFRGVAVDSRLCEEGNLFVALEGERTDGHLYIENLIKQGISCFLISKSYAITNGPGIQRWIHEEGASFLVAENPLESLQKAAQWYLEQMPHIQRIGVTGSSGKTTTKELLASLLKEKLRVAYTKGNYNSEIGLPLMAFQVDPDDEVALFEMGVNHPGEMDILVGIVKPTTALITNISQAHVGMFPEEADIAKEKMKIFSQGGKDLTAFVHQGDIHRSLYEKNYPGHYISFGMGVTEGVEIIENRGFDGWHLSIGGFETKTPLFGRHNLENLCGAVAVARAFGVSDEQIADGIEATLSVGFGRSALKRGRFTVIEDCYNANPGSVSAAIALFSETKTEGRKFFVLGAMGELGNHAQRLHREIGERLAAGGFQGLFFYGEEAAEALRAYKEKGGLCGFHTDDFEVLRQRLKETLQEGDWVYLKGSRGLALERLEEDLL